MIDTTTKTWTNGAALEAEMYATRVGDGPRPAVIRVRDLRVTYGAVEAVRGVSFEIVQGEVFGLLGPNGAGKTTILETLEGLRPIQHGSIAVDGIDPAVDPRAVQRRIGV